jgi:HAD superfamily hydrolase (TIGR01450 family)
MADRAVAAPRRTLHGSTRPLAATYDVALLDLDGVVYVGVDAVPGAPAALEAARAQGMRLAFVTNNAARTPEDVAAQLRRLGVPAEPTEVITSSQAAAHYLAERLPAGARVLVVGTDGLTEALRDRGLIPVSSADDHPVAVVQGYSPDTDWRMLAEGAVAIRRGLMWVATNVDATLPSPRGPLPGNGSLVAALRYATAATPVVTGKPDPTMHRETVERSGADHPIVVGDRLDTDIEGATAVGCASLLVLTGVTTPAMLLDAPPPSRPDYLAPDLGGLLAAHPQPTADDQGARCGAWSVTRGRGSTLVLRGTDRTGATRSGAAGSGAAGSAAAAGDDPWDALRALCAAAWLTPAPEARARVTAGDDAASAAMARFDLTGD